MANNSLRAPAHHLAEPEGADAGGPEGGDAGGQADEDADASDVADVVDAGTDEGIPEIEFSGPTMTVREAMNLLRLHRATARGGAPQNYGWRRAAPDPEAMRASILRKIAAIERARPQLPAPDPGAQHPGGEPEGVAAQEADPQEAEPQDAEPQDAEPQGIEPASGVTVPEPPA